MWLIGTLSLLSLFAINNYGCPRMLVTNLNGDVKGKEAVMVDDMIDTARTIAKGADMLHREGEGAWKFMHTARMLFSGNSHTFYLILCLFHMKMNGLS
ncbi:putative ribose-phosphate diphosphokinase [Helianthus annuus]|nr:putative ribose-phosphate diphosphokinase [Helianthus annuus]KAJ0479845.1 putative ribose-phosphate diphosphokinase [Helianthus annuus]KAJ0662680.1 putative ribose-phosphate diphosphokinase [Helianthus annuus]KAJ0670185.1 putative ribose-phosphate diphosphokinase [Helianthus annuus]KAJ0856983.1 putative ribose-phosphate diphosphokinase [Helianthus annuus]